MATAKQIIKTEVKQVTSSRQLRVVKEDEVLVIGQIVEEDELRRLQALSGNTQDRQRITFGGSSEVTGGTFKIGYDKEETADLPWDSDAAAVEAAIDPMIHDDNGGVTVVFAPYTPAVQEKQKIIVEKGTSDGTFKVSYKGEETSDMAWDVPTVVLESELNALSAMTADGGVALTGDPAAFGVQEIQKIVLESGISSGTFSLMYEGQGTNAIDHKATPAEVEAELNSHTPIIADGGVTVLGFIATEAKKEVQTLNVNGTPTGGRFRVAYQGSFSPWAYYKCTGACLEARMNRIPAVVAAGGVTVTGPVNGPFLIEWNQPNTRDLFTSENTLQPVMTISHAETIAGETPIGGNEQQTVIMETGTTGGGFRLSYAGEWIRWLPHGSDASLVEELLNDLPQIKEAGLVTVSADGDGYIVDFRVVGAKSLLGTDSLLLPGGKTVTAEVATAGNGPTDHSEYEITWNLRKIRTALTEEDNDLLPAPKTITITEEVIGADDLESDYKPLFNTSFAAPMIVADASGLLPAPKLIEVREDVSGSSFQEQQYAVLFDRSGKREDLTCDASLLSPVPDVVIDRTQDGNSNGENASAVMLEPAAPIGTDGEAVAIAHNATVHRSTLDGYTDAAGVALDAIGIIVD